MKDASGNTVAGSVAYNSTDNTAPFTTSKPVSTPTTVTVTINGGTSGVTDADGVQLDSNGDGKLDTSDGDKAFSFKIQSTTDFSLSLLNGWNLISLPVEPTNNAISTLIKDISKNTIVIWAYPAQVWKFYDPQDEEGSTQTDFDAGLGYWIKTTAAATWTLP